jgi:prepilin-type N-terminal cleavage/methylation domain-containing protein
MFPSAFRTLRILRLGLSRHRRDTRTDQFGFSLMEVMVTLVIATLLGAGLVRFYKDSYHAYSLQDQIADRNQNAHFVLSRLVEVLQQAGSSLPSSGFPILRTGTGTVTIGLNPRAAEQFNGVDTPKSNFVAVGDASKFANIVNGNAMLNTTHVLIDFANPASATVSVAINTSYNSNGFTSGIRDNATGMDSIYLSSAVNLDVGDKVYGYREDEYLLSGSDLVIRPNGVAGNQMILAEDIQSLDFIFRTDLGVATTNWDLMRSASISVVARTDKIDPNLSPPGYHTIALPMNVMFRNKI